MYIESSGELLLSIIFFIKIIKTKSQDFVSGSQDFEFEFMMTSLIMRIL